MKNKWIWVAVIVVIIVILGFLGRHKVKSMLMGSQTQPIAATQPTKSPSPTASASAEIITTKTSSTKGSYLADSKGMSLYVFDKDTKGVSNCESTCATTWPPYTQTPSAMATMPASVTIIKRTDGSMQYAYNGMPLYYFQKDKMPGDTLGDGVGGTWHLAKPQ